MISAVNIGKRFRSLDVLSHASLEAESGAITLLTGANGSGKTTLLRILAGLLRPDAGSASIGGKDLARSRLAAQRLLSFLPQNVAFHPAATPTQILAFYGRLRGVGAGQDLLEEFGLADAASRPVSKLSGGMLQRLGIALALLPNADALILDEPGAGLDPDWRDVLRGRLVTEARRGRAVLLTSHLPEEWAGVEVTRFDCREGRVIPVPFQEATAP